ncbi:MAG: hypothetical protein EU542_09395 [Promethearchaeota archaeon]|nr:MAG: hypothetical protein EU542_09395 [Candidatus Lokiarchaeota archaeon]
MIEAILSFEFVLIQKPTGEVEPEFKLFVSKFKNENVSEENLHELITRSDLFSIFYHHTTNVQEIVGTFSNLYEGRLKDTPYQVSSYFKQEESGTQFLVVLIFSLDEDMGVYEELIRNLSKKLDYLFESYETAKKTNQISLLNKIINKFEKEINNSIFQIERLANLDKIQRAALIFNSYERLEILEILRNSPMSKREVRNRIERIKENPNLDVLLEPFLELNLIRRDWIKGKRDKRTGIVENQGEYLFLTKDIDLIRVPNNDLLNHLKDFNEEIYSKYEEKVIEFFSEYNPNTQSTEERKKIASLLLNPDIYDFFALLKNKFYPKDKMPHIFSDFAEIDVIFKDLKKMNIITEIKDKKGREWILLLTDIKPIIFFPEYLLQNIRNAYHSEEKEKKIPYEVAKKALDLLEVAYPETVEF